VNHVLRVIARAVEHRPLAALLGLGLVTLVLAGFARQLTAESDLTAFSPSSERAVALDDIGREFGGQGEVVQVIVEAPGGSVLTAEALRFTLQIAGAMTAAAGDSFVDDVRSFAGPFARDLDLATVTDEEIRAATVDVLADGGSSLLSVDLDEAAGTATAGMIVAVIDSGLPRSEVRTLALDVRGLVESVGVPDGIELVPFSQTILNESLADGMGQDLPLLLGLSLFLVLAILAYTYRSVTDLLLGLTGLVVTIIWTYGWAALLGPGYLGLTGPLSQISTIVPVLLVGLGIDYAIHLTGRYRETQRRGASARRASATAVVTVGGALVLATATTVVGFMTNVASPIPPVADFGIFTAAGVLSAFVVFLVLIPATRHVIDRRAETPADEDDPDPDFAPLGNTDPVGLSRLMRRAALISERWPGVMIGVAAAVTAVAVVSAVQVDTTFDQREFIPSGSLADRAITALEDHFGGDLSERSYLLVRDHTETAAVANALLDAEDRVAQSVLVRMTTDGDPDVSSPASVAVAVLGDEAAAAYGWDGSRFAPDADIPGLYEAAREESGAAMAGVLADGLALVVAGTSGGQERIDEIAADLEAAGAILAPAGVGATFTSQQVVLDEILDSLRDSQVRGIAITLVAAALLLVGYYWYVARQPLLGLITMTPSTLVTAWIIGSMWALGLSFNVLTAMVAALAIGIGVPYGIHITHRFRQEWRPGRRVEDALREVVTHTGGALLGSAATTAAGFGVLAFSSLEPIRQFGLITALAIVYALISATFVQPALLKVWAARRSPAAVAVFEPDADLRAAEDAAG
jgi:uncharacterized protein